MTRALRIPDATRADQARAADPANSVWVSANAGSGKTHVLAQRVVRLLLKGAEPSKILCLTYTRAAAANMSNRVFKTLSSWTMLPDAKLSAEIAALEGRKPSADKLAEARRLFARALETPGGLKIQTIHAFCESVLHQFPIEANIAAHFDLLDPAMEAALIGNVRREMLTGAAASEDPALAEAFATVLDYGGEFGLEKLLAEIVAKRDGLRAFLDVVKFDASGVPYRRLFAALGFSGQETLAEVAAASWPLPGFTPDYFRAFEQVVVATGARIAGERILPNACAGFAETEPARRLKLLAQGLLTKDGEPYAPATFTKAMRARLPDVAERYEEAAAALIAATERFARFRMLDATRAALQLADFMVARYERAKNGRGLLDFNDLIVRTRRLLLRKDAGPWVQYKLDKGIDHILLDEAQDTSPEQWEVVKSLAEEFFAGAGARNLHRTVFAVGDEKQSIYSFQGAVPSSFAETKHHFASRVRGAEGRFEDVSLNWSFRSTADVLAAVDAVFGQAEARRGLTREEIVIEHRAIREAAPGYVELWPTLGTTQVTEPEDWREAIDHASAPAVRLAETIATTIKTWIRDGEILEGSGKRVTAGDILVLVRKRDSFMHALSRALKNKDVPVAGADRLSLPGHIAVQDLIALGRLILQPDDDLSLAAVLRSPIFGISESTLFELAWSRDGLSLGASLRRQARGDVRLDEIARQIAAWTNEAAYRPVFEFYSAVLGRDEVRRRMIGRLGHEAGEILDEFLNFCLAEERTGLPGLEAFLATLEASALEVKREMDQTRNEVRIMTVHASKGLEAPVVFLVDSGGASFTYQHLPSLLPFSFEDDDGSATGFLWSPGKELKNGVSARIAERIAADADDEYRRLLYVGMTRAEDRLIVAGFHGVRQPGRGTWHAIVQRALSAAPATVERPNALEERPALRYRVAAEGMVKRPPVVRNPPAELPLLPAGLFAPLPRDEKLPRPLTPSGASLLIEEQAGEAAVSDRSPVLDPDRQPSFAIARGLATHRLLQVLPGLPEAEREAAARLYLDKIATGWPDGEAARTLDAVRMVLESAEFAPIFAAGSRAEVSLMGMLEVRGRQRAVSGTIDRLAVTDEAVLIVDYKTNRPPPERFDQVPEAYVLQLALYAALLKPLYPGRKITAALLYTEAPRLVALPAEVMDTALVRLTGP